MTDIRTSEEVAQYAWLISPDSGTLLARITDLTSAGVPDFRIAEQLRADWPVERVALAMTQRDLRTKAGTKFTYPDALFFTREGLEQSTSDQIATHRAQRFRECHSVVDLCCGIGGDLMALAAVSDIQQLTAVDLDPVHLMLANTNAQTTTPGRSPISIEVDVRDVDLMPFDGTFIDPARRSTTGRFGGISSEPPIEWALALETSVRAVGIKTAPGIPHHLVPDEWELEMIALGPDLKEAVLWSPALASGSRTASVIADNHVHQLRSIPGDPVPEVIPEAGQWLLDPNPAVTRAGLVEDLARHVSARKIDDDIAFLIADSTVSTPFARTLKIIAAMPWHEKHLRNRLKELDAGPIDIRRRGLAGDVDKITKRLRGKGSRRLAIAMTRVGGEPWAIVCDIA